MSVSFNRLYTGYRDAFSVLSKLEVKNRDNLYEKRGGYISESAGKTIELENGLEIIVNESQLRKESEKLFLFFNISITLTERYTYGNDCMIMADQFEGVA